MPSKLIKLINDFLEKILGIRIIRVTPSVPKRLKRHIAHSVNRPIATYSPWVDDEKFMDVYRIAKNYTLVDIYRCYELFSLAQQTRNIEGDVLEVGVWRGGSSAVIQKALTDSSANKKFYIADTFEGVVKTSDRDSSYKGGEHSDTNENIVRELYSKTGLPLPKILKGIFPDDHPNEIDGKIAFLHSDVDAYESTKDIIEWALPRLSKNAIVVFDDYGFRTCEGVTDYCNELRNNPNLMFVHNLNGHAIFINKGNLD